VVGVYAGAVTLLGALFETRANQGVSLVATGIVAILLSPLRLRLQRAVDRLFYGRRDDLYAVVTQLAQAACRGRARADSARAGRGVGRRTEAPPRRDRAARRSSATHGRGGGDPLVLALAFHGQDVGRLDLARRAPGEDFTSAELRLFEGSRARSASLPTRWR
jgi:hypothetical protein